ncbi:MAG: hypothetical protein ACYTEG_09210 [Planctomycetota bacterium]|jgi:hypothetical protein
MRWAFGVALALVGGGVAAFLGSSSVDRVDRVGSAPLRVRSRSAAETGEMPRAPSSARPFLVTHPTFRETLREIGKWPHTASESFIEARLGEALTRIDEQVERQYLIFLAARMLPAATAAKLLRTLVQPGDHEDAVLALAFNGDKTARAEFARLAERPSRAVVHNLVDTLVEIERIERMGNEDARDILRSYRALEVLTRKFYFRIVEDNIEVAYQSHFARTNELDAELLPLWLARYPGHPGSDDVALILGEAELSGFKEARWRNLASVLPDQRRTSRALRGLLEIVESRERRSFVERMLDEPELPNRILLEYVRLRRMAAEDGFDSALEEAAAVVERLPYSSIGFAWRNRWAAEIPRGLSGLPAMDSLRHMSAWSVSTHGPVPRVLGHMHDRVAAERTRAERLSPPREAMELSIAKLAFQFRCWETAAELGRRRDRMRLGELYLRNHAVLFPVYARRGGVMDNLQFTHADVHGWHRSLKIFRAIETAPAALSYGDALAEEFSYISFEHFRAHHGLRGLCRSIQRVIDGYEDCARDYPRTEFARIARERVRHWQQRMVDANRQ